MALRADEVVLKLKGESLKIVENYEVHSAILTQPAAFSLRLGHGGVLAELISRYPENTPFELFVNGRLLQTGFTDGLKAGGSDGSQVTFDGRDVLGKLVSAYAPADKAFSSLTYHDLVAKVLEEVGYKDFTLIGDDVANRKAITGTTIVELTPSEAIVTKRTTREAKAERLTSTTAGTKKVVHNSITMKVGGRWYEWLKTQLDRAGLFLWVSGDGVFILSVPNPAQRPAYQITRISRGEQGIGKVVDVDHERNVESRFTKMLVYGRGGGRRFGRQKIRGEFVDPEMAALFGGPDAKFITVHDNDIKSQKQAVHYARRRMAELNRDGWRLSYTMSGHSTEGADGNRAVWSPNTVVQVDDREIGVKGDFWIEDVSLRGNPQQTATLRLMRPGDCFFALDD